MTFTARLKAVAADAGRLAAGTALGLGLFVAVAGLPAVAFAAEAPEPRVAPRAAGDGPALWVVRDADSTLYLFGTVHILRPTTAWGSDKIDAAFDSADDVWFEIANLDDQSGVVPLIQQYGVSLERPLSSLLSAEDLAGLDAAARSIGSSAAQMEPMRPWLAALTLSVAPLVKAGYDPASGVELILKARADAAGKPVRGLETMEQQIRILSGMSEEAQVGFLRSTLEYFEDATAMLDGLVEAWATGDVEAIERLGVADMREASEEVYQAMLVRRNTDWADQIQTHLEGSGVTFIAVGAAHLAGEDSVQAILAARGVEVARH